MAIRTILIFASIILFSLTPVKTSLQNRKNFNVYNSKATVPSPSYKRRRRTGGDSSDDDGNSSVSLSDDDEGRYSKRSRNRAQTTSDAMLGVFGEDSDEEGGNAQSSDEEKKKRFSKPVEFVRRKQQQEDNVLDNSEEEEVDIDNDDDDIYEMEERIKKSQKRDNYNDSFVGFSTHSRQNSVLNAARDKKGNDAKHVASETILVHERIEKSLPVISSSIQQSNSHDNISIGVGGSSTMTNKMFADLFRKNIKGDKTSEKNGMVQDGVVISLTDNSSSTSHRVTFTDEGTSQQDQQDNLSSSITSHSGLGSNDLGTEKALQMPAPVVGKDFGNFEKHTKGFGAKYLEKFAFKGRLGKREQGIAQPIDVQVRPNMLGLGYGGFKEVTKANRVIAIERAAGHGDAEAAALATAEAAASSTRNTNVRWKSETRDDVESYEEKIARRAKRDKAAEMKALAESNRQKAKKEYQTAAELLAADEASSFGNDSLQSGASSLWQADLNLSSGGVIDMRGPNVRVLSSLSDSRITVPDMDEELDETSLQKHELSITLGRLLSESEIDLRKANAKLRTLEASSKVLEREFVIAQTALKRKVSERDVIFKAREAFSLFVNTISNGIKAIDTSNTSEQRVESTSLLVSLLENSADIFENLRDQNKYAYSLLHLVTSGPLVVHQILKRLVKTWEPPINSINSTYIKKTHPYYQNKSSKDVTIYSENDGEIKDPTTARLVKGLWKWADVLAYPSETSQNISTSAHLFSKPRFFDNNTEDETNLDDESNLRSEQLAFEKLRAEGEAQGKYFQAVVETTIFASIKSAVNTVWNPVSSPSSLIALIEALSPRPSTLIFKFDSKEDKPYVIAEPISNLAVRELLSLCVLPRLVAAIDSWRPASDPFPAQDWTVPWAMPHLLGNDARAHLFPPLRFKLQETLSKWHPSDESAITVLRPWSGGLWDEHDKLLGELVVKSIVPKLVSFLREFKIATTLEQTQESIESFSWITRWGNLIPNFHFICLLEGEFFKKWLTSLTFILGLSSSSSSSSSSSTTTTTTSTSSSSILLENIQQSRQIVPDFYTILKWYEAWRPTFPSWIFSTTRDERLLNIYSLSIDLIELALNIQNWDDPSEVSIASICAMELLLSRGVGPDSRTSYTLSIERRNAAKANAPDHPHRVQRTKVSQSVNGVIAGIGQSKLTFKEYVETSANAAGFGLVPTRSRGGDTIQVFLLGDSDFGVVVQLDKGVIFMQNGNEWIPVSLEGVIDLVRTKRIKELKENL